MSTFPSIVLNDGRRIPGVGFGTWRIGNGDETISQIDTALNVGYEHLDTAQAYRNEAEVGEALKLSGLKREELWITTKWSGADNLGPRESCEASLKKIGTEYVDLLLIHSPRLCKGDIPKYWAEMESIKKDGLARSIGVSNFEIEDLKELLASANIVPAVNQIEFHPYIWKHNEPLVQFQDKHKISTEAYSVLKPLTQGGGGPLDKPLKKIAKDLKVAPEQVLIAWAKAKGVIVLTMSSKKERMEKYLDAGSVELSKDQVDALDEAGAKKDWTGIVCSVLLSVAAATSLTYLSLRSFSQ